MGENTTSGVVSLRLPYEVIASLTRMAEMRDMSMNAMVGRMITRRVSEIRQEEGW
jgi:predicted HicB family RNase H-like nuclease